MEREILKEIDMHGQRWNTLHDGYFNDLNIAFPLIEIIRETIDNFSPDIVVDLGGGTGFIIKELIRRYQYPNIQFVNIDISTRQLDEIQNHRILPLKASVTEIKRELIDKVDSSILFFMRSVLHYFGLTALKSILQHLRLQMRTGEFFIHQTACFEYERDASILNLLYKLMGTDKEYPLESELNTFLESEGWEVVNVNSAPKLLLTSYDLAERYKLTEEDIFNIKNDINREYGEKSDIFVLTQDGFNAYLDYKIFTCIAK